jgi:hypothetical protein
MIFPSAPTFSTVPDTVYSPVPVPVEIYRVIGVKGSRANARRKQKYPENIFFGDKS